jgi:uncharacterized membrane protein YphA (DoxX/SURF4 family)/intracellular sulfur oxidation DsrE/DsrF family protein
METTTKWHSRSFLVLRIMSSFIFIAAGINHLLQPASVTARLQEAPLGSLATWMAPAETLVLLSGAGLLLGGFMLLAGYKTRQAALLLLAILIPITLTIQVVNAAGSGPLFKNLALMGMLLFFAINGAMYYGLDQYLSAKKKFTNSLLGRQAGSKLVLVAAGLLLLGACHSPGDAARTPELQAASQQTTAGQVQNYAVLISQPNHLKAAVHTAETITAGSPYHREAFVVMACGKSVEAFVKGSDMASELEKGRAAGITYKVCGMSLRQFNIDPATLAEGLEIIPNGLTYMFDLQQQGYQTVEL